MTEHESIRANLALAAAGVLGPDEIRRVEQHARACELCRRDLEAWSAYAQGLRKLPQPSAPDGLMERTRARIIQKHIQEHAVAAGQRRQALLLGALAIFGWATGWSFWILARAATGGSLNVLGANLVSGLTWSVASTVLVWMTAGTAAVVLRRREMRRFL